MKKETLVRNYYVLPCCLLLLNLCTEVVSYKTKMIADPVLRTGVIMGMVLAGGTLVGFVASPLIGVVVGTLQKKSKSTGGGLGELLFLIFLGVIIYILYYQVYIHGPQSILPDAWKNPR
jgi:hypothetical protein